VRPDKYGGIGTRAYPRVYSYIGSNNRVVVTTDILPPLHPHMDIVQWFFAELGRGGAVRRVPSCLGLRQALQLLRYEPAWETA